MRSTVLWEFLESICFFSCKKRRAEGRACKHARHACNGLPCPSVFFNKHRPSVFFKQRLQPVVLDHCQSGHMHSTPAFYRICQDLGKSRSTALHTYRYNARASAHSGQRNMNTKPAKAPAKAPTHAGTRAPSPSSQAHCSAYDALPSPPPPAWVPPSAPAEQSNRSRAVA